jgi:uncharacterized membrane protein YhfC
MFHVKHLRSADPPTIGRVGNQEDDQVMKTKQLIVVGFVLLSLALLMTLSVTQPDTIIPALNSFLMIAIGLFLGFYLSQRFGLAWGLFGAGALTFIASQVLHIPFNIYLLNPFLEKIAPQPAPGSKDLILWGILLGLSAGVFEETARYLILRFWRKEVQYWKQAIMFGAGHGGIEAVILGIIGFISFVQLFIYRQIGAESLGSLTESGQVEALQTAISTYWSSNWYEHLWGALERFSVIPIHLSATVLVYQSLRRKNLLWVLAAILWHALVDFIAVVSGQSWGIPITEAILFGLGMLGWGMVFLLRDPPPPEPNSESSPSEVIQPAPLLKPVEQDQSITKESLEESRYE